MGRVLVKVNNFITRLRRPKVSSERILLLVPHCLQAQSCERNVRGDLDNCARCGRCPIAQILALRGKYGIRVELVSGGRKAVAAARQPDVGAIVAVACPKELTAGLKAVLPKPTLAVANRQPEGPCVNTTVDMAEVEQAIQQLIAGRNREKKDE